MAAGPCLDWNSINTFRPQITDHWFKDQVVQVSWVWNFDQWHLTSKVILSSHLTVLLNHLKIVYGLFKPCSDERQNGFKSLKLKRKFLQPSFTPCEHDCFCLKTLKHFRFKCLRRFLKINFFLFLETVLRTLKTSLKINHVFYWFPIVFFIETEI